MQLSGSADNCRGQLQRSAHSIPHLGNAKQKYECSHHNTKASITRSVNYDVSGLHSGGGRQVTNCLPDSTRPHRMITQSWQIQTSSTICCNVIMCYTYTINRWYPWAQHVGWVAHGGAHHTGAIQPSSQP
eukprot:2356197-Amphidinium_carterae.2